MDLAKFTSRELNALHIGYNTDTLAAADKAMALLDRCYPSTTPDPADRAELRRQAEELLNEARAHQAKGQEVYAEITRRCGMDVTTNA